MSEETYSSVFFIIIVVPFLTWALIVFLCFLYFLFEKCGRWFEIRYGRHLVVETDNNADHTESTLLQSLYAALFVQTSPFVLKTKKFSVYRQGGETTTNTPRPQDHEKIDQCAICLESFEDEDTIGISSSLAPDRCPHIFHQECIATWLSSENSCPSCRGPFCSTTDEIREHEEGIEETAHPSATDSS